MKHSEENLQNTSFAQFVKGLSTGELKFDGNDIVMKETGEKVNESMLENAMEEAWSGIMQDQDG